MFPSVTQRTGSWVSRSALIFLTVLFSVHSEETKAFEQFGCKFESSDYALKTETMESPAWGSQTPEPMTFENETVLKKTLEDIKKTMSDVIAKNIYDDIHDLADFLKGMMGNVDVRKQEKLDFDKAFLPYRIQYKGVKNDVGLAIELYNKLIEAKVDVKKHYYLTAVGAGIDSYMMWRLYKELNLDEMKTNPEKALWPYPYHNHVAGFMKIKVGTNNTGYVLMDPGFALQDPIVIMDGECAGLDSTIVQTRGCGRNPQGERFEFELSGEGPFIKARSYAPSVYSYLTDHHYFDTLREHHLYYFGKPYCSFLDTTAKPNMVLPKHSIEKRNPVTNKVEASIATVLFRPDKLPQFEDRGHVRYLFTTFNADGNLDNQKYVLMSGLTNTMKHISDSHSDLPLSKEQEEFAKQWESPFKTQFKLVLNAMSRPIQETRDEAMQLEHVVKENVRYGLQNYHWSLTGFPADHTPHLQKISIPYGNDYQKLRKETEEQQLKGKLVQKPFACYVIRSPVRKP